MSLRRISDQQFADGTAIAGDELESGLADLFDHVNKIPRRDVERRYVQTQFVSGYLPASLNTTPFFNHQNQTSDVSGGTTPDAFENEWRAKGVYHHDDVEAVVWTHAIRVDKPIVVVQLDVLLLTDSVYDNDFVYDTSPPAGKTDGDSVDDFAVSLTVDSPWATDDREQDSLVLIRKDFKASGENISLLTPTGFADMLPNHPDRARLTGVWVHLRDIVVPIPQGSRVRWSIVLPEWSNDEHPWDADPHYKQNYSVVMTALEPVQTNG